MLVHPPSFNYSAVVYALPSIYYRDNDLCRLYTLVPGCIVSVLFCWYCSLLQHRHCRKSQLRGLVPQTRWHNCSWKRISWPVCPPEIRPTGANVCQPVHTMQVPRITAKTLSSSPGCLKTGVIRLQSRNMKYCIPYLETANWNYWGQPAIRRSCVKWR